MKDTNNILMKFISTQGYKNGSPDVNNPINVIPSNRITMKDVNFPVQGTDNLGNSQMMMPGGEYLFGGDYVIETPMKKQGGQKNNDREMVVGIADIISQVKDSDNRREVANKMVRDFKRDDVKYDLNEFLTMAGVMEKGGEMIKRADGSYSKRGLWDNIRANKGSGKKPTKEMLEQERKINKAKMGGGLLSKTMNCPDCGWEWKAADGGSDVTTCHKCGGEAMAKSKMGGQFETHMMYDPTTKQGYQANTKEDHLRMSEMGFIHQDKMYQEGGEQAQQQGPDINDALGEISMMLENGTDPNEILQMLIEQGVPEEQGMEIIQSAQSSVVESDIEEEDVPVDTEDIEDDSDELLSSDEDMKYGGIKIDPKKKGTFKAQATKMGMSVQQAAEHILDNKQEYSPEMVKKANFARNFAKELGGQMYEMAAGGTVPDRYKNMGFSKVGVKKQSTRPGKKWMVLAKKDDKYKVVHGGWKGMKDFTQHGSEKRKDRFWDRMGGRDSAKAKDPFSPLYWHKRFGTWAEGGEPQNKGFQSLPKEVQQSILENMKNGGDLYKGGGDQTTSMYDYENYRVGDQRTNKTESNTLNSLDNNAFNRGLATANILGDPKSMIWALPNKGLLGKVKGIAGAAAGLSGAVLGYEKLFANPKTTEYVVNNNTKESGTLQDVTSKREQSQLMKEYSQPSMYQEAPLDEMRRKNEMLPSGPMGPGFFDGDLPTSSSYSDMAKYGGAMREYQIGGEKPLTYNEWLAENSRGLMGEESRDMNDYQQYLASFQPAVATSVGATEVAQTPAGAVQPTNVFAVGKQSTQTFRGDNAGIIAANNALAGLGMANQVLGASDYQKEYEQRLRETGNTMNKYNPQNAVNPFGNYTLNAGPASNFALVANTPIQDFGTKMSSARYGGLIPFIPATRQYNAGGEFYADEEEIKRILAMGGEIEYID